MEVDPRYQRDTEGLALLYVRAASGQLIPMSTFAKLTPTVGPLAVNHSGQLPSVTISFNLKDGVSLGDAFATIQKTANNTATARIQRLGRARGVES